VSLDLRPSLAFFRISSIGSSELPNNIIQARLLSLEEWFGRQERRLARVEALVTGFSEVFRCIGRISITSSGFTSEILTAFPSIFEQFKSTEFSLLWKGSRDGFRARTFHDRCDGHSNTLTVILDTEGKIFGGFTPVSWESPTRNRCKSDPSLQSFVFSFKNPHHTSPLIFPLLKEGADQAIDCDANYGPIFHKAFAVSSLCNLHSGGCAIGNQPYGNATGIPGGTVLTGAKKFKTKEIEVFEIRG
jgi:hypothetical protein